MRQAAFAARLAVLAAGALASTTCQFTDLLKPAGLEKIAVTYASDSVLVVAAPARPSITVTVNGAAFSGARLLLTSSDSGVVAVHGDTLVPKQRGTALLTVALEGSTLPRTAPGLTQKLFVVADTVTVDSASVRLSSLGDTVTLAATARDALGGAIAGASARWSSSDTNLVVVTGAGRLTARANGAVTVRAMVDRDTAAVPVTVTQVLTKWTFEPASLRVDALTATGSVVATAHDARGSAIAALAPATWSIGDATIASVGATGTVTAIKNGATMLYAATGGVRDSVPLTVAQRATQITVTPKPAPPVTSLGGQLQLTARAFDRKAVEIQGAALSWLTLEPTLARVGSDGLVTALGTGTAHIVAALDQGADTATVAISNDPATIAVSPDSALATSVGDTLIFRAVARNGRGDSVGATITWRTPDSTVVNLLADGRAIGLAVGVARVIATVGAKADTGLARVTNVPTSIAITPVADTCTSLGDVDTLPVTITNARGAALTRGSVTWSSDDPTVIRVSTAGVMTAKDTGQTVVRATSGLVMDSVVVTVLNRPASIVVNSPAVDTLTAVGQTLNLPADVRNARGAPILNYPVAWRSSNRTVVDTVLPSGNAQAIGWGSTVLIAQAGSVADTVRLAVVNPTRLYVSNVLFAGLRVGTTARPYGRIQDGVNAADAGDTVIVLRGAGGYSESVALARRIVILGDSTAYAAGGRNPSLLPLLAHDTGAAAITANTTAPVTVRYLAVRHTLDGPAFSGDGSDAQLEWVYVNPPGTVTTRIGRGILVANSQSGSLLRNLRIRSVRGYGISLVNSSAATITADSIIGVDSVGLPEGGAGVSLRGGSSITVTANVIRATRGPRVLARGAVSALVQNHTFSGQHPLIQLDSVTGLVEIRSDTFQVGYDPYDASDSPNCSVDTRCAGVVITDSRNGALVGGYGNWVSWASPANIHNNIFYNAGSTGYGSGTAVRVRRSQAYAYSNNYRHIQYGYLLEGNSKGYFFSNTADTTLWLSQLTDVDSIYLSSETTHESGAVYKFTAVSAGAPLVSTLLCNFNNRTGNHINFWDTGAYLGISQTRFTAAPNAQSIFFYGSTLYFSWDTLLAVGDSAPGAYSAGVEYQAAVLAANLSNGFWFNNSWIMGFTYIPGLRLYSQINRMDASASGLTRNRVGLYIANTVPTSTNVYSSNNNALFDNVLGGLQDMRSTATSLPGWWWGDARGPRGAANPAATGDSVLDATAITSPLSSPPATGSVAAAVRQVRGTGQTAVHGTTLPKALTTRVVDALGFPVAGVSVTFTVTSGGGNVAGLSARTVTTNADGLAETTFTLGAAAGTNTVTATGTGLNTVTFTETGT